MQVVGLTLPSIYILNKKGRISKKSFKLKLKLLERTGRKKEIRKIIIDEGGVAYAENKLMEISNSAKNRLDIFEDSDLKESLKLALDFNLKRNM